jgi:hypothetical protein
MNSRASGKKASNSCPKPGRRTGLPVITELLSEQHAELVAEHADILQIGTRNAQNFQLLIAAARTGRPVLLKRGLSMKIEEWLLAGEYVLAHENPGLMFCERGVRTFETYTPQYSRSLGHPYHEKGNTLSHRDRSQPGRGSCGFGDGDVQGPVAMGPTPS